MTLVDNLYSTTTLTFQILKINHELPKNSYSQMCDSALVNYHCHPVTRRGRNGRDHMAYGSWFYNYLCNRYLCQLHQKLMEKKMKRQSKKEDRKRLRQEIRQQRREDRNTGRL